MSNKLSDPTFEALLRQAVIDDYIEEIDAIPPNDELKKIYSFSPEFDKKMKKLFNRVQRKDFFVSFTKYAKRVAVILIVVINILFAALLTVPEVRAAVGNVIVEWFEKFTSISYHSDKTEENATKKDFRPQYLPDGYTESETIDLNGLMVIMYSDGTDDTIRFTYSTRDDASSTIAVDNENSEVKEVIINGETALIVTALDSDGQNGVVFKYNGYAVTIWSNLSTDTLLMIADSVAEYKTQEDIIKKDFRPQFLPDGYSEIDVADLLNLVHIMYSDGTDDIIHFSYTKGEDVSTTVSVDNEYTEIKETVINGETALIVTALESDTHNGVVFKYEGCVIEIWSYLSTDTLLMIADSITEYKMQEDISKKHFRPQYLPVGYTESKPYKINNSMVVMYSDGTDDTIRFSYTTRDDSSTARDFGFRKREGRKSRKNVGKEKKIKFVFLLNKNE